MNSWEQARAWVARRGGNPDDPRLSMVEAAVPSSVVRAAIVHLQWTMQKYHRWLAASIAQLLLGEHSGGRSGLRTTSRSVIVTCQH